MKANTVVEFAVIHYGWMSFIVLTAADALNGKVGDGMSDEEYLNMFIKEAKKAYKTIDNKSYNFPITINTAYKLAVSVEKCLKKQPDIVRCKDCRFLIDHYGFMDDGCCRNMRNKYNIKFKPDKDWFCADGKPKEGQ